MAGAITAIGTGIGIYRGVRKKQREDETDRVNACIETYLEEHVTPQIEELKIAIRELGDDLKEQFRAAHQENSDRLIKLETLVEERQKRRRP